MSMSHERRSYHPSWELFASLTTCRGGVLPRAMMFALPCACLALALKTYEDTPLILRIFGKIEVLKNNAAYSAFSFGMGFLLVFRTSQSYSRFWEGVSSSYRMMAEWFDFASAVVAFTRYSKADFEITKEFHHRLVRLVSLLHASALTSLRGNDGSHFELIDIAGLEAEAVERALESDHPTTLIGQWVQELVMEGLEEKIITAPPPIVSRCFQQFANGMVAFEDSMKIQSHEFPFNYTQLSAILLIVHWFLTPFVLVQWIVWPSWLFCITFIQVLFFWALYFTAVEIEYPFKRWDVTDNSKAATLQSEFNHQLLLIIDEKTREIPSLQTHAERDVCVLSHQNEEFAIHGLRTTTLKRLSRARSASRMSLSRGRRTMTSTTSLRRSTSPGNVTQKGDEEDRDASKRHASFAVGTGKARLDRHGSGSSIQTAEFALGSRKAHLDRHGSSGSIIPSEKKAARLDRPGSRSSIITTIRASLHSIDSLLSISPVGRQTMKSLNGDHIGKSTTRELEPEEQSSPGQDAEQPRGQAIEQPRGEATENICSHGLTTVAEEELGDRLASETSRKQNNEHYRGEAVDSIICSI